MKSPASFMRPFRDLKLMELLMLIFLSGISMHTYSQAESKSGIMEIDSQLFNTVITASANVLMNTPNGSQMAGGFKVQIFISEKFSLDADIVFSRDYFHFSTSAIGLAIYLVGSSISDGKWFPLAMVSLILSVEHISYHLQLNKQLDVAPYLSLLRYRSSYRYNDPLNSQFAGKQYCFATGVQINKYFGRFVIAPYGEYSVGYKDGISGFNTGIYCGILLPNK